MGHWTKHTNPINFVPRAGPAKMNRDFAPLVFIDAQGEAQSNAEWSYLDANGKALFDAGVPLKYWTSDGAGSVREMTALEQQGVDDAETTARLDDIANQLDDLEDILRAFVLQLLDERNRMAVAFNDLKNGIATANNLNDAKAAAAAIADEPIRTVAQIKTALRNKLGT